MRVRVASGVRLRYEHDGDFCQVPAPNHGGDRPLLHDAGVVLDDSQHLARHLSTEQHSVLVGRFAAA